MANKFKTWGQTRISINGMLIDTAPKPTFRPGGVIRETVEADNVAGFHSEKPEPSYLECEVLATAGMSMKWLQSLSDETVIVEKDTGVTYIMRHAVTSAAVEASDGKIKLVMTGPEAEEMTL